MIGGESVRVGGWVVFRGKPQGKHTSTTHKKQQSTKECTTPQLTVRVIYTSVVLF